MILALIAALLPTTPPQRGAVLVIADPTSTTPEVVELIDRWLERGPGVELVMSRADDDPTELGPERARFPVRHRVVARELESRELAAAVRGASVIAISGGRFTDWYEALFPSDGPARLAHALFEAHVTGVPIVAFGGAGSFVSGAGMVARAEFERPVRDPHESRPHVASMGLSVGARALVDAPGWTAGDALALLREQHETKVDLGLFLEGDVALLCEPAQHRVRVLGPGRVLAFDLDGARRQPRGVWEARVSVLARGDEIDLQRERVLPAEGRRSASDDDPLVADGGLIDRFLEAARSQRAGVSFGAPATHFEFRRDEDTRRLVDADGRHTLVELAFEARWD